jgi:NAD(P)-dependent dehydrogenase (short-subunit alcohol dehydrogenase family)
VRRGAHVVLACRSAERGRAAAAQLTMVANASGSSRAGGKGGGDADQRGGGGGGEGTGSLQADSDGRCDVSTSVRAPGVDVELLDLASLASVRAFVRRWQRSGRPLDLLICK